MQRNLFTRFIMSLLAVCFVTACSTACTAPMDSGDHHGNTRMERAEQSMGGGK